LRKQINKHIIDKGEVVQNVASAPLLDIYGSYDRSPSNKFFGAIGGQLQQLYYVIDAMYSIYPESDLVDFYSKKREDPKAEAVQKASNPRELLMEQFFVPFMLSFLKELKCDYMQFMIPPKLQAIIDLLKVNRNPSGDGYDFTRLNDQQYYQFRHAFVEEKLFYETYRNVKNPHAIENILNVLCMVLCNRVPKNVIPYKADTLISKIKLIPVPKGVEVERRIILEQEPASEAFPDGREVETIIEANTNEKAVVRILVPTKKVPSSELVDDKPSPRRSPDPERKTPDEKAADEKKEGEADAEAAPVEEEKKADELVDVEDDQNDMALAVPNRIAIAPAYSVYVLNQYAQRMHRYDFVQQIVRQLFDFFQEHGDDQKKIQDIADKTA